MAILVTDISNSAPGDIRSIYTQGDPILKIDDRIYCPDNNGTIFAIFKIVGVVDQTPAVGEYNGQRLFGSGTVPQGTTILTESESLEHVTQNYVATTYLNFQEPSYQSMVLTGNITLAAQHHAPGRSIAVRFINNNSVAKDLSFPGSWTFIGGRPTSLLGNKTGILSLTCFSGSIGDNALASDLDVVAAWSTN